MGNSGGPGENARDGETVYDNQNAIIRNNFIYRAGDGDVGITVNKARNVKIYNNTVILNGTFPWNIEYRFKMFWLMEGALFTDVGNIWAINKAETRDDAKFYANEFHKQLAIDGGIGIRFDFTFFLLRLDWGVKLRDPKEIESERWLFLNAGYKPFAPQNNMFNFSIGYPF
jgi:outer membrane protein assembly factor BamA